MVVRGREEADPLPFHSAQGMGAPDQENVEGHKEGAWVETSKSPLGQVAVGGEIHRGGFGAVKGRQYRVY